jgi:hypothetical protein
LNPAETNHAEALPERRTIQRSLELEKNQKTPRRFLKENEERPSHSEFTKAVFESLPLYPIPCQWAGLLEHWIEPTLQVGSIHMG